jgi:hypothetical protein
LVTGELWAFATPILPFIHKVDPAAAEKLYRRAWKLDFTTDSYTDVKEALESTYNSLGAGTGVGLVTCAGVGDLYNEGQTVASPGCTSGDRYIAGYKSLTDVSEHAQIDLDLQHIIAGLGATCASDCALSDCSQTSDKDTGVGCNYDGDTLAFPSGDTCQWDGLTLREGTCSVPDPANYDHTSDAKAFDVWLNGANSAKTNGMRAISEFASGAATKGDGASVAYRNNKHISVMNDYWRLKGLNQYTWGEDMVRAAFEGTTIGDVNFGAVGRTFRKEAIQKGIVYMNIFPYVIWEMQDQVSTCYLVVARYGMLVVARYVMLVVARYGMFIGARYGMLVVYVGRCAVWYVRGLEISPPQGIYPVEFV